LDKVNYEDVKNVPSPIIGEELKLYKGSPTCFLMATTERMIINPYPYQIEAYRSFCLELVSTESIQSIYNSYLVNHFKKPWEGEIATQDHRLIINALSYQYYSLDGPIPEGHKISEKATTPLADVVVIQDSGECYISLNISLLPAQIAYDKNDSGEQNILQLGHEFIIKLLSPQTNEWEKIGEIRLNERRRGFWHAMLHQKEISAYSQIGVFYSNGDALFRYPENSPDYAKGKPLPILWQSL